MSWHPSDLVTDADLLAYEGQILAQFGVADWQSRRAKALEDWLFPALRSRGFDPYALRTRYTPDAVLGYTGSAFTDLLAEATNADADDLDLAAVFATAGTDRLYIGSAQPFRGVFLRLADSVSADASALSVAYWNGAWEAMTVTDGTAQTTGATLSGGGAVTWTLPVDWAVRAVNGSALRYWVRLSVSATPTGATAGQIGCIRASALRAPATFRTLQLIFREAPTGADGPWSEKAEFWRDEADRALQVALSLVGGEFDSDGDDLIDATEAAQTAEQAGGGPFRLERG